MSDPEPSVSGLLETSSIEGDDDSNTENENKDDNNNPDLDEEFQYDGTDGGYLCDSDFIKARDNCDLNIFPFLQNSLQDSYYELHLAKTPYYKRNFRKEKEPRDIDIWDPNPFPQLGYNLVEPRPDDEYLILTPGDQIIIGTDEFVFSRLPIFLELRSYPGFEIFSLSVTGRFFSGTLGKIILNLENRSNDNLKLKYHCKIMQLMAFITFGQPFSQDKNIKIQFPSHKQLKEVFNPKYYLVSLLDPENFKNFAPHLQNYDNEVPSEDSSLFISTYKEHFIFPQEFENLIQKATEQKKARILNELIAEEKIRIGNGTRKRGKKSNTVLLAGPRNSSGVAAAATEPNSARGGRGRRKRGK